MEIKTVPSFLDYYRRVHARTEEVICCIPPEKMDWTYREEKFTLADLVRHIAAINRYMFAENVQNKPSAYPGHGKELADGHEAVMDFFGRAHREAVAVFGRLTDEQLQEKCTTPSGTPITVWKWLRLMVEHEIHHRGQIYVYLSILGVATPPLYGMSSEEVRAASQPVRD